MTRAASAGLVLALVALTWGLLHVAWYRHGQLVDYGVYSRYGNAIVHRHEVPYRDFELEYPPGALPVFVVPALLDGLDYNDVFQGVMAVCAALAALGVLAVGGRAAGALAAVAPLLLGSVVISRFDLWPAALTVWALAALVRRRTVVSAILLGTAFAAKLWPLAIVPLIAVWVLRTQGGRRSAAWVATATATAAAWFLPFAVIAPGGLGHSFHEQLARPLQVESFGSSILIVLHHFAPTALRVVNSFGSQNVAGSGVAAISVATTVAEIAALVAVWVIYARGGSSEERLVGACAAAVAALLAFGKVFSPQFLIWLIPLVPLVRSIIARVLFGVALVLTQVYFPERYWNIVTGFYRAESVVLLGRNLAVVALFGALLYASQRSTAASRAAASSAVSMRSGARTSA